MKNKKLRLARELIANQSFDCPLCHKPMTLKTCNVDHIMPKSRGGTNAYGNLQLTHVACNLAKGNQLPTNIDLKLYQENPRAAKVAKQLKCLKGWRSQAKADNKRYKAACARLDACS